MFQYNPNYPQKTLMQLLILDEFKATYTNKFNELMKLKDSKKANKIDENDEVLQLKKKNAFKDFNLSDANFSFQIGLVDNLFTESSLLFKKMFDVLDRKDPECKNVFYGAHDESRKNVTDLTLRDRLTTKGEVDSLLDVMEVNLNMKLEDVVNFIANFHNSNPDMLYGALLKTNSGRFVNILHPLIAQGVIKTLKENQKSKSTYKIILYVYKKDRIDYLQKSYNMPSDRDSRTSIISKQYTDVFKMHLLNVLAMTERESEIAYIVRDVENLNNKIQNSDTSEAINLVNPKIYTTLQYGYEYATKDGIVLEDSASDSYIQPVQIINDGVIAPYYGITVTQFNIKTRQVRGYQLSPFLSCNVGYPHTYQEFDSKGEISRISVSGGSVCTGGTTTDSDAGRKTLNHANLGSPYFRQTYCAGAFDFARVCVDLSLNILTNGLDTEHKVNFVLPKSMQPVPTIMSFEQFKTENKKATMKKYLEYVKSFES